MITHGRSFVIAIALAAAAWALLLPATPAAAYLGGGGYAGPPAGLSPGPSGVGLYPGMDLPSGLLRWPTLAFPPWPLALPMGEAGVPGATPDRMRSPYAGLALRDVGGALIWSPVYNYDPSTSGLPASLAWPWWQYHSAQGWAPSTCYAYRYVGGRWVCTGCW